MMHFSILTPFKAVGEDATTRAAQSRSTRRIPALLPLLLFQHFVFWKEFSKRVMEAGSAYRDLSTLAHAERESEDQERWLLSNMLLYIDLPLSHNLFRRRNNRRKQGAEVVWI